MYNKRHRIFIAINLPHDIKKELGKYQEKWKDLPAKWVNQNNLHITLIFLGDLTDLELGEICVTTKDVVKKYKSFNLNLNKISYGPEGKTKAPKHINMLGARPSTQIKNLSALVPPKMIWANGEKSKELVILKNELENSLLEKINFKPESRGFTPHITLAKISSFGFRQLEIEERPEVNQDIDLPFTIESIEVMESVIKRGGPEYTIIESHILQ